MLVGDANAREAAAPAAHPLLGTAARLSAMDERIRFSARTPAEAGWVSLSAASARETVAGWLDELPTSGTGMRNVAGARVGLSLACCIVRPLMATLHIEQRVPVLTPDSVFVRRARSQFVEFAVAPTEVYALARDPEIGHPALHTVPDVPQLLEQSAHSLYWTLAPVLNAVRAEGRYGLRHLWGGVLDMIGATSLLAARLGGLPQQLVWRRAEQLCELVYSRSEQPKVRYPTPFAVNYAGGDALFTVKGTCCLQYREPGLRAGEQDEHGTAYCETCPFLREDTRLRRCASTAERDVKLLGERGVGDCGGCAQLN
ncbi:MAG: hypothetical protein ACRDQ5_11910 [Sciscionella sp.]